MPAMSGVYIAPDDPNLKERFGIDVAAIEAATGRKVSAVWRESTWADDVPEALRQHVYGDADAPRIVSGLAIYFDCGEADA